MKITCNVRIGRVSYPQLETARGHTLRLDNTSISGLAGGLVYAPGDRLLGNVVARNDRTLQLGSWTLAAELSHLPSAGYAAVVQASPGYHQYGAQSLLAPLCAVMSVEDQRDWWQALASVVAQGERPGLPPQLVAHQAGRPARWLRGETRLIRHREDWFVALAFELPSGQPPHQAVRQASGIDLGLINLATVATGQGTATARPAAAPDWIYGPAGSRNHRQLYNALQYAVARNALESLMAPLVAGAAFVALEKLDLQSFRTRFTQRARRVAVVDWAWSTLPQVMHAHDIPLVRVDPRYTSEECHACHSRRPGQRHKRRFACRRPGCGVVLDADLNAALVIRARGQTALGIQT